MLVFPTPLEELGEKKPRGSPTGDVRPLSGIISLSLPTSLLHEAAVCFICARLLWQPSHLPAELSNAGPEEAEAWRESY